MEDTQTVSKVNSKIPRGKKLKLMLEQATQQMYRRNVELADANKLLSLLRSIDNLVLGSQEHLHVLCRQISELVVNDTDYSFVSIVTSPQEKSTLTIATLSTAVPIEDEKIVKVIDRSKFLELVDDIGTNNLIQLKSSLAYQAFSRLNGQKHEQLEELLAPTSTKTVVLVKLTARARLVGVMIFGLPAEEASEKQLTLIGRLGEVAGIAIDNKLLYDENQRVLLQLQRTNDKLKALNETKDDFIGMASHQLRTPLTSVKGYLSLVIDEDAGKINNTQKELLTQAFVSSQRMVYLIADLLNVSRLRTGKFVIERTPTNIAEMISDEIGQLHEMAATRGLELTYKPPKSFPDMPLDETKTRQVVMNFIDNAIYYTPTGGHIRVEVKDLPKSVELRVIDDGIGVPKDEHHHLFTKFYRAKNAQRARPDGTGLGLFMAKKVIVVQGGAMIFDSIEGKGSTFGFSFPKSLKSEAAKAKTTTSVSKS